MDHVCLGCGRAEMNNKTGPDQWPCPTCGSEEYSSHLRRRARPRSRRRNRKLFTRDRGISMSKHVTEEDLQRWHGNYRGWPSECDCMRQCVPDGRPMVDTPEGWVEVPWNAPSSTAADPHRGLVGAFEWQDRTGRGMTIKNPFRDETNRFRVSPSYYGFERTQTGGGCEAWVRDEAPAVELWVTDMDAQAATCDCGGWMMGLYFMGHDDTEDGPVDDEMQNIWMVTTPGHADTLAWRHGSWRAHPEEHGRDRGPRPAPHDVSRERQGRVEDLLDALQEALNWSKVDAENEDGHPTQEMLDARVERLRNVYNIHIGQERDDV